jgi:hypothetical protein
MTIKRLMIAVDLELGPFGKEYTAEQMAENLLTSWGEYTYLGKVVEAKWLSVIEAGCHFKWMSLSKAGTIINHICQHPVPCVDTRHYCHCGEER